MGTRLDVNPVLHNRIRQIRTIHRGDAENAENAEKINSEKKLRLNFDLLPIKCLVDVEL